MQTNQNNKKACFRNVLSKPLQLDGDWRVALAEITLPSSIKNVTTKDYFIYTPRKATEVLSNLNRSASAGVIVQRPDFSSNATFPDGEIESIENILELLKKGTVFNKPLLKASCEQKTVEVEFAESYGISVRNRSLFDVLVFTGVLDTNRGGYFIGTQNKVRNQTQPMKGDFPADIFREQKSFLLSATSLNNNTLLAPKHQYYPSLIQQES